MRVYSYSAVNMVIMFLGAALVVFVAGVCVVLAVKAPAPTELWAGGGAITGALVGVLVPSPRSGPAAAASAKAADVTHAAAVQAAVTASQQPQQQAAPEAATQAVASVRAVRSQIHATNARITRGQGPAGAAATGAQTTTLSVQTLADDAQAEVRSAQQAVNALNQQGAGQEARAAANTALVGAQTKQRVLQSAAQAAGDAANNAAAQGIDAARTAGAPMTKTIWGLAALFVVFLGLGVALETANPNTQGALLQAGKTVIGLASSAGAALVALFAPEPSAPVAAPKG